MVRTDRFVKFADDIAHQIHIMGTTGAVVSDGAGHAMIQHDPVTVEAVHDDITIPCLIRVGNRFTTW